MAIEPLRLRSWTWDEHSLTADAGPVSLNLRFPLPGIVHLSLAEPDAVPEFTPAIAYPLGAGEPLSTHEASDHLLLESGGLNLRLGLSPLVVELGTRLRNARILRQQAGWQVDVPLRAEERCYALGEKTGFLDKRGRSYVMWNTDAPEPHLETLDPLYLSIPWIICFHEGQAYGLYLDDPSRSTWDVGHTDPDRLRISTPRASLSLYLVTGPSLAEVVRRFAQLTGRMPMPPRWALGYQQSRWSYVSADRLCEVAREFRSRQIPCDVLYADIDYMDGYRVFTWHPEAFSDPVALMRDLKGQGFKVVPIVDPGVKKEHGYTVYEEGLRLQAYCQDADGIPYVGEVWPGATVYPDFMRAEVRQWWGNLHRPFVDLGMAGIWNDMNEPSNFITDTKTLPLDVRHGTEGQLSHSEAHNLYAFGMAQATREALTAFRPDDRPFILTRAGFAGIQRYAAVWTGDNISLWHHLEQSLPMLMNMGLSGLSFVGSDVGGFFGDCSGELLVRWTQLGTFTPFFRNHSAKGTRDQEPWSFGPEVEELCRQAIRMRYEWLPYLYTAFWRASSDGTPIMRPMVYDYPTDPELASLYDQALIGDRLMIAPIYRPQARKRPVYFPDGGWIDLWSGERIEGPCWRLVDAPLDRMPVYVRAGSVIPKGPWVPSVEDLTRDRLSLEVFQGEDLAGEWYDDDGISPDGPFAHWRFEGTRTAREIRLRLVAVEDDRLPRTLTLLFRGLGQVSDLRFEGRPVSWQATEQGIEVEAPFQPGEWAIIH